MSPRTRFDDLVNQILVVKKRRKIDEIFAKKEEEEMWNIRK
jgi:hypothetical protein